MKITSVKSVGKRKVYDLSVADVEHYILDNGVVTHNTGAYYSSDDIWIIGRQQYKKSNEVRGWNFIINIEKSRHVREKSKIPINVRYEDGVSKWSGMFDIADKLGYMNKPKTGWYEVVDPDTGEVYSDKLYREDELDKADALWTKVIENSNISEKIHQHYKIGGKPLFEEAELTGE